MSAPRTKHSVLVEVRAVTNGYLINQGGDPSRCEEMTTLVASNPDERDELVLEILRTLVHRE